MSLMLLLFSFAEEKTSVGDNASPKKNGTGWSGRGVELDLVGVVEYLVRQVSLMLPFSSAEEKT